MAEIREKHPNWFKMKIERRELIRQLSPETAVNVLLACWDYLETGEKPLDLSPIENIAFASFIPDMEEAWKRYNQRIGARNSGKGESNDIVRSQSISGETEEEPETEPDPLFLRNKDRGSEADKPPTRPRFVPPTLEEVAAYCQERGSSVDPGHFISYYQANGWMVGRNPMKDWRAAVRTWEKRDKDKGPTTGDRDRIKTDADYGEELFFTK